MLQTMRSSAKFVFWILAVAFIGGFLLVETSGLLGRTPVTPTTAVATVNGRTSCIRTGSAARSKLIHSNSSRPAAADPGRDQRGSRIRRSTRWSARSC